MPPWLPCFRRRIRPAVAYQLIDPVEEVNVRFCFQIERCGTKGGRIEPRPGLGGGHRPPINMACLRSPASGRKALPLGLLSFRQVDASVTRENCRWNPVELSAEQGAVLPRPLLNRGYKALIEKLSESLAPIMLDGCRLATGTVYQS